MRLDRGPRHRWLTDLHPIVLRDEEDITELDELAFSSRDAIDLKRLSLEGQVLFPAGHEDRVAHLRPLHEPQA
jgi:hypothetical protein